MTGSRRDAVSGEHGHDIIGSIEEIYDAVGDVKRWRLLTDHLASARVLSQEIQWHLEIARRAHEREAALIREVEALLNVLDQLALGAMLIDSDRRLLGANVAAARLLEGHHGLMVASDRIMATHDADDAALCAVIARVSSQYGVAGDGDEPFVLIRRAGRQPLSIWVLGSRSAALPCLADHRRIALLLVDPEVMTVPGALTLRQLFGFTEREAEFAELLMKGLSVEQAANALGVEVSTTRTFLSQITAKTDTHGQVELVKRLLDIPGTA
jgi:DNA-binding CsgD family transcriptional regulator